MISVRIKNINFKSPIIAASGTFGYGDEVKDFVDLSKVGCIITKSITLDERKGNPSPRILDSPSGMINAIGLANVGVEQFCKQKIPSLNLIDTNFIVSVAGSKIQDYVNVMDRIEKSNGRHVGYEINISCPNIKKGGMEFGVDENVTYSLVSKLRKITDKIIIVKLSPNVTNIEDIALSVESAGADAISAINTFVGLAIDYKTGKMLLNNKYGGVSGPAIKPLALAKVHKIYSQVKIPVIGIGGITSFKDVVEFIRVGASMVQVGTLNYRSPSIIENFNDQLKDFLKYNQINSIADLVGNYIER
tara:strand:- start:7966 stop:8877 length:912 start_codon:yes stop_codon:yes gene_type:complete